MSDSLSPRPKLSRRAFLKSAGLVATATAVTASCETLSPEPTANTVPGRVPLAEQYPAVPMPPATPPEAGVLQFFTPDEAQLVEALTARLLPGTPDDPGAREAGVLYYIDNMLATRNGLVEATYRHPPYADTFAEGESPPTDRRGDFGTIWVAEGEVERYGYQSILTPAEVMRLGLAAVERYARETFDRSYAELEEAQQDQIITDMLDGNVTGFEPLDGETFFHVLRRYTSEGMFSDPAYGGNRDLLGWKLLGYPGAQRAYTAQEIQTEGSGLERPVWSLAMMPHFHPGQPANEHVLLPVTGSDEGQPTPGGQP